MPQKHFLIDDAAIDAEIAEPFEIIDPLYSSIDTDVSEQQYLEQLSRFTIPQQLVFAVCCYRAEVNNGGHLQFYDNSAGIVWPEALNGLAEIGLTGLRDILKESADLLGGSPPRDRDQRMDLTEDEALQGNFDELDSRFYEIEGSSDVSAAIMAYIRKNRADFHLDATLEALY